MGIQTRLGGPCPGGAEGLQHHRVCGPNQQVGAEGRGGLGPPPKLETQEERLWDCAGWSAPQLSCSWLDREVGLVGALVGPAGLGESRTPRGGGSRGAGPCLKLGGGGGASFSLLSAWRPPESPLNVARMTQLPQAAKAR